MKPTAEQQLIIDRVRNTSESLAIEARAGGAKTTTLCLIAEALGPIRILALAFNKKIALEMAERLPTGVVSSTINALGNKAWQEFRGRYHKINAKKMFAVLSYYGERIDEADREEFFDRFSETLKALRQAKTAGFVPSGAHPLMEGIIDEADFFASLDEEPSGLQRDIIIKCLRTSIKMAFDGELDFDDQIYMSTLVKSVSFPTFDAVLVDEAQDLSELNHKMLRKIVKKARLIAVGDPCQAIYGFRGASENSMDEMRGRFNLSTMYLTICFRCAPEVVEAARWRAPDMQPWPGTPAGKVIEHASWSHEEIFDGDAVICRNNAPLFYLALALLRARRSPELLSGDIIPGLVKVMKKLGKAKMPQAEALAALTEWAEAEKARSRSPDSVEDKAACIRLFIEETGTLGEAIEAIEALAVAKGRIKLMTGHKSKGLEFNRVWFLDQHLCRPKGQDLNVKYVIQTRAKQELHYIDTDKMA